MFVCLAAQGKRGAESMRRAEPTHLQPNQKPQKASAEPQQKNVLQKKSIYGKREKQDASRWCPGSGSNRHGFLRSEGF